MEKIWLSVPLIYKTSVFNNLPIFRTTKNFRAYSLPITFQVISNSLLLTSLNSLPSFLFASADRRHLTTTWASSMTALKNRLVGSWAYMNQRTQINKYTIQILIFVWKFYLSLLHTLFLVNCYIIYLFIY